MKLTATKTSRAVGLPSVVVIGDADPETGTCTVIIQDSEGREIEVMEAPEDDMIPNMRRRGYRFGVYLGNNTYNLLNN